MRKRRKYKRGKMKILSWNINQGKDCLDLIEMINSLQDHNPEVIFLQDFLNDRQGQILRNTMKELGWEYQYFTGIGSMSGILILSSGKFSLSRCNYRKPSKSYGWLDILFDDCRISVLAVNIPQDDRYINADEYWERLLEYSKIKTVDDCLIIGSLCPEVKKSVHSVQPIGEIMKTGWIELIQYYQDRRETNTRVENNMAFRMDYAFASRMVKESVSTAYFSKAERAKGFTRLPMVLELL